VFNVAVDEAEAWLMADRDGFAKYISVDVDQHRLSEFLIADSISQHSLIKGRIAVLYSRPLLAFPLAINCFFNV